MISNALAAAAVGFTIGLTAAEIKGGIESFEPVGGRLNVFHTSGGYHLVDDTYNANPASMTGAIQTLGKIKRRSRGILVIGDMLELGKFSEAMRPKMFY